MNTEGLTFGGGQDRPGTQPAAAMAPAAPSTDRGPSAPVGGDAMGEQGGLFAVFGHEEAVHLTYTGLYALQHRGQEGAGLVAWGDGDTEFAQQWGPGLVGDIFSGRDLAGLVLAPGGPRDRVLGQVQQTPAGQGEALPLLVRSRGSRLAVALNGGLLNGAALRQQLEFDGAVFQKGGAGEVLAHLAARAPGEHWADRMVNSLARVQGGFSAVYLTPEGVFAYRDPWGIRPLLIGRLGGAYVISSESCALDAIGAEDQRELAPGQWVWLDQRGSQWGAQADQAPAATSLCLFEYIYFARPDSRFGHRSVYEVRREFGRQLGREQPAPADVVLGVPDSSLPAALGYSEATGIPYDLGLIKNRYVGRTFIRPRARRRSVGERLRLNPVAEAVRNRRVVLIDDSMVRGATTRPLVAAVRQAGAKEVHLRIASPPFRRPCPFSVSFSGSGQLIAAGRTVEEVRQIIGADSLQFLSVAGLLQAAQQDARAYCQGCFAGSPVQLAEKGESPDYG